MVKHKDFKYLFLNDFCLSSGYFETANYKIRRRSLKPLDGSMRACELQPFGRQRGKNFVADVLD